MHLVFEKAHGRFKSNCNILSIAWMPYYDEQKFSQTLLDYRKRQLIQWRVNQLHDLTNPNDQNNSENNQQNAPQENENRNAQERSEASQQRPDGINQQRVLQTPRPSGSQAHLNSRVAEFTQRAKVISSHPGNHESATSHSDPEYREVANLIRAKFGRMDEFGWLVIGNGSRMIGITLTSTVDPPQMLEANNSAHLRGDSGTHDIDLMKFDDQSQDNNRCSNCDSASCHGCSNVNTKIYGEASMTKTEFDKIRPDRQSARKNFNLRGHLDEIILVKCNELYQKLATVDSKGNVLIWCKINDKFTIQTPFYNRSKSVADFVWSNDGKTALICYTDSFILVGSSSGQRHWHSMLNLEDYYITCASWSPNDDRILLGVSNGNVVLIDLARSELAELVINQSTNIRSMCWSSSELSVSQLANLDNASTRHPPPPSPPPPVASTSGARWNQSNDIRSSSTVSRRPSQASGAPAGSIVSQRRLSRDNSLFSRYLFCSNQLQQSESSRESATSTNNNYRPAINSFNLTQPEMPKNQTPPPPPPRLATGRRRVGGNILALNFADNTIKLYNADLDDPDPKSIQVGLEAYSCQWSASGQVLGVAGFSIQTSAPSIGCLRCKYVNQLKFYDRFGRLIHEHKLSYTRYPITAFTWAHDDRRLIIATGPRLHVAKVFPALVSNSLALLAASQVFRCTKFPVRSDILEALTRGQLSLDVLDWPSFNCPVSIMSNPAALTSTTNATKDTQNQLKACNNPNVFLYQLPEKVQLTVDRLASQTIRQPFHECWSLSDIVWHVPREDRRHHCTLICYTSEREISTTGNPYRTQGSWRNSSRSNTPLHLAHLTDPQHPSDQNRIFVLYVEFQGSMVAILRARRVGLIKPEFVIFDPEDNQLRPRQQHHQMRKVSDVASSTGHTSHQTPNRRLPPEPPLYDSARSPLFGQPDNCSQLHGSNPGSRTSPEIAERRRKVNNNNHANSETELIDETDRSEPRPIGLPGSPYMMAMMMNGFANASIEATLPSPITPSPKAVTRRKQHQNQQLSSQRAIQMLSVASNIMKNLERYKMTRASSAISHQLNEQNELVRVKSNVWGTKFKMVNVCNRVIKQRCRLGSLHYKASVLHLQPRQIFLAVKDMSNYCCLCSKHHHSCRVGSRHSAHTGKSNFGRRENRKSDWSAGESLMDAPIMTCSANTTPLLSSSRLNHRLDSRKRKRNKQQDLERDNKVQLPVGDSIRVMPKLEGNQRYQFAPDRRQKSDRGRHKTPASNDNRREDPGIRQDNQLEYQRRSRQPNSELDLLGVRARSCSHGGRTKPVRGRFRSKNQSAGNEHWPDREQDDVLTLTLSQGDQMRVEMSSREPETSSNSQQQNGRLDDFLAEHKSLKSIQSITQMIVDLSSRARQDGSDDGDNNYHSLPGPSRASPVASSDLASPSKQARMAEPSDFDCRQELSKQFVPPEAPVHRARRPLSSSRQDSLPPSRSTRAPSHRSQSVSSTPRRSRPANNRLTEIARQEEPRGPEVNGTPNSGTIEAFGRRLSRSARRLFGGSLRSLYGGTALGYHLAGEHECSGSGEEAEPLVCSGRFSGATGNGLPNDLSRRIIEGSTKRRSKSQMNTPARRSSRESAEMVAQQLVSRLASAVGMAPRSTSCRSSRNSSWSSTPVSSASSSEWSSSSSDWSSSSSSVNSSNSSPTSRPSGGDFSSSSLRQKRRRSKPSRAVSTSELRSTTERLSRLPGEAGSGRGPTVNKSTTQSRRAHNLQSSRQDRGRRRRRRHRHQDKRSSVCSDSSCCCARELRLTNRAPVWNELSQVYQLDFGGRVTQESAKNLQIDFEGKLALQFGRIDRCTYTLDYKYPFNAVQAMSVALASLTQRLK